MKPHTIIALPYVAMGMMMIPAFVAYAYWTRVKQ